MRDRLIGLIKQATTSHLDYLESIDQKGLTDTDGRAKFIADHLLENGVIVPPCKVGQTVYYISFGNVYKGKCHAITLKPTLQIHLYDFDGDNASYPASKVFHTKEEAEKALKEREDNG